MKARAKPRAASRRAGARAMTPAALMAEARKVRRQAYADYSEFPVGAALLTPSGRVFLGCNVENASSGLTICAERSAVFSAVAAGEQAFAAIAVAAPRGKGASPCGACRQVLHEFAPRMWVYWHDARGRIQKSRLNGLLPRAFVFPKGRR